jgi:cyclopropane fatty-acyl-phospholipid synthase-like methyltransferase
MGKKTTPQSFNPQDEETTSPKGSTVTNAKTASQVSAEFNNTAAGHGFNFILFILEHGPKVFFGVPAIVALLLSIFFTGTVNLKVFAGLFVGLPLLAIGIPTAFLISGSYVDEDADKYAAWEDYVECHDSRLASRFAGKKMPIETFIEAYMHQKLDLKCGMYELLLLRNQLFRFCFTWNHFKYFFKDFALQGLTHSHSSDEDDIKPVYNRGNDFYNWFLGETMIYTSGLYLDKDDDLAEAQRRKLNMVCQQLQMQPGEEHLDLGCGWGTLICHAAEHFGTRSTGVTLAKEQAEWAHTQARERGVDERVKIHVMDYRDIPFKQYDKITCLEMAEHVGIRKFQQFLVQVRTMLKDEGMFYLQIAGLRRKWQYEDLVWGCFMGKYIFPGADASCPLGFVVDQMERAGFEVHRVENTGCHYSLTIKAWYDNWIQQEENVVAKYTAWWYRLWVVFLAWSAIIAAQGSSTVFMITAHKNHKNDQSSVAKQKEPFGRINSFVGPNTIGLQQ